MAGVSSLLKSASSTAASIQAANDAQVAYEWQNSAQTYDDFLSYQAYLNDARNKTTDPTKLLSYDTTVRAASRSYMGNEIQRQTQAVMEGSQTTQGKMQVVENLYNQAAASGDANQAQNLASTWDSLSVQLQNEAKSAAASFSADSAKAATAFTKQISDTTDALNTLKDNVVGAITQAGNPKEAAANIAAINASLPPEQQIPTNAGIFDVAAAYIQNVNSIYSQAHDLAPDAPTADAMNVAANKFNGSDVLILNKPDGEKIKLKPADVQKQVALSNVGQTMFTETNTANGKAFTQNKVDNYQFGHDANGNVVAIPTYSSQGMNTGAKLTDLNGKQTKNADGSDATYETVLKQNGFSVTKSDGSLLVQDTTGKNRLNGSDSAQAYVGQNGQLQFAGTPGSQGDGQFQDNPIYNINFDEKGGFKGINKDVANPFLAQYSGDYKGLDTPYFQGHADDAAQAIGTAGLLTHQTLDQFDNAVGINGMPKLSSAGTIGSVPRFSSAGSVLQNAANINAVNQARTNALQAAQAPAQLVSAPAIQLQSPSIGQSILNSRNNSTISIAPVKAPAATISTKPQTGGAKFAGVSTATPKFNISF